MIDATNYRRVLITACFILSLGLALANTFNQTPLIPHLSIVAYSIAGILGLACCYHLTQPKVRIQWPFEVLMTGAMAFFAMVLSTGPLAFMKQWVYVFPILLLLLLPFKHTRWMMIIYSLVMTWIITQTVHYFERAQMLATYLVCTGCAFGFAAINELKNIRLKPLVALDKETGAFIYDNLPKFLQKEIARAGREGTALSLICLDIEHFDRFGRFKHLIKRQAILNTISQTLKTRMRVFDSFYRQEGKFYVVLPYMTSSEALEYSQDIFTEAFELTRKYPILNVYMGITSVNAGETEDTVLDSCTQALRKARQLDKQIAIYNGDDTQG